MHTAKVEPLYGFICLDVLRKIDFRVRENNSLRRIMDTILTDDLSRRKEAVSVPAPAPSFFSLTE